MLLFWNNIAIQKSNSNQTASLLSQLSTGNGLESGTTIFIFKRTAKKTSSPGFFWGIGTTQLAAIFN